MLFRSVATLSIVDLPDNLYRITLDSNTISTTNATMNLQNYVSVGDTIVLSNVHKRLVGTVNVLSGSNLMIAYASHSANFINDFQEGDTIYLSTGNTVTIKEVTNANVAILSSIINVTATKANINLVLTEVSTVNSLNANTMFTSTKFKANATGLSAVVYKNR